MIPDVLNDARNCSSNFQTYSANLEWGRRDARSVRIRRPLLAGVQGVRNQGQTSVRIRSRRLPVAPRISPTPAGSAYPIARGPPKRRPGASEGLPNRPGAVGKRSFSLLFYLHSCFYVFGAFGNHFGAFGPQKHSQSAVRVIIFEHFTIFVSGTILLVKNDQNGAKRTPQSECISPEF